METNASRRYCNRCHARMASDNREQLCRPCQRVTREDESNPPDVPPEFWTNEELRYALIRERHIGHAIRIFRKHPYHGRRRISQEIAAKWLSISQAQLARIESGRPVTDLDRLVNWARILRVPQELLWFSPPEETEANNKGAVLDLISPFSLDLHTENGIDQHRSRRWNPERNFQDSDIVEEDDEEMERRRLLQSLIALGVHISPLSQPLDNIRSAFGSIAGHDDRFHLDDWEETVAEYGYSYLVTPPLRLIPDLASDLVSVRSIVRRIPSDSSEYRSWCRVGGVLSGLMAKTLSNLDHSRDSRQWWNMAQHLTDSSGDLNLRLWVRGQRVIHGLYEARSIPVMLRQIQSAADFAHDHACAGLADVSTGHAQVAVLSGDYRSAERELERSRGILEQLPPEVAEDAGSVFGWGEDKLRYTEAWVYSYIGDESKTDLAIERALELYPASDTRSPVQANLMRAFAHIRAGDITEGIRHASAVYEPLNSEQRTTMVDALARRVVHSIPREVRNRADVIGYRALISAPSERQIES